jgi:hypothetical protein
MAILWQYYDSLNILKSFELDLYVEKRDVMTYSLKKNITKNHCHTIVLKERQREREGKEERESLC